MYIVLANQWYPPESGWGGVASYNHAIAHAYCELGHRVTVIARRDDETTPEFVETNGIRVHRLLMRDHYYLRRTPLLGFYSRALQQLSYSWRVRRAIKRLNKTSPIDVIEFAEINAEAFFFARTSLIPFVVRCHTPTFVLRNFFEPGEFPYDTRVISACEKDVIRRAHAVTAPSNAMAQQIAEATGIERVKISVIPNPVPSYGSNGNGNGKKQLRSENELTVLYVGRLERFKGVTILAEAIPHVLREFPNVRFVLAGEDRPTPQSESQHRELELQLRASNVLSQVKFLGRVDHFQLEDWYSSADICVVPSMYESFSYTCAEAMAAGKPVVATRVGGIPETVCDGLSGVIVEPGDAGEFAEAIVRLLKDETRRIAMGRAGRAKVLREFDPIRVAQQNLEVYQQARRNSLSAAN